MRNTGWVTGGLTLFTGVVLAVTACGSSSTTSGGVTAVGSGSAYGGGGGTGSGGGGRYGSQASPGSSLTSSNSKKGGMMEAKRTKLGEILANQHGMTVYYYTADKPGSGMSVCNNSCAAAWPPVGWPVRIPAGVKLPGIGTLSYIVRPGGQKQLTINGYPIYKYIGDKAPGQVNGNGVAGAWFVIKVK